MNYQIRIEIKTVLAPQENIDNYKEKFFLRKYAANINFERIENYFKNDSMILIRKKHPDKKNKSKSFRAWGGDLERKLKTTQIKSKACL